MGAGVGDVVGAGVGAGVGSGVGARVGDEVGGGVGSAACASLRCWPVFSCFLASPGGVLEMIAAPSSSIVASSSKESSVSPELNPPFLKFSLRKRSCGLRYN